MHHRILAWNRVEGERNTHNIGWIGGQNGFIDLHKVIGSAKRWNVVVNILLHPEIILLVEREPGQKGILLGSRNGIFHDLDLAVRIDAAHLVTGFGIEYKVVRPSVASFTSVSYFCPVTQRTSLPFR
jgi:hypothetical protein